VPFDLNIFRGGTLEESRAQVKNEKTIGDAEGNASDAIPQDAETQSIIINPGKKSSVTMKAISQWVWENSGIPCPEISAI